MATEWTINSDIYDIVSSIENVQKKYIDDEDETTLSLGIFGFITDTEAKKIQTATIMAGQLGNEMFPTRALLTKNVLTHAAYHGITDFNAVPANITVTLCVKTADIANNINDNNEFFLDAKCPIYIGEYEFHLDYDIKIKRKPLTEGYSYSAQYILKDDNGIDITNRLSNIANPYLAQPFIINIGNEEHIGVQCVIRQIAVEEIEDSMVSDSIIENKTYTFGFDNQMADFTIEVEDNGVITKVVPYMYGSSAKPEDNVYCWYLYTDDNTIRITFDSKSYIPGLNSKIYIKSFTTLGAEGNFDYLNIDQTSEGLYVNIDSDVYNYKNLTCYLVAVTDSTGGTDKKSKTELQKLIPKAAMARGSITTETDLSNYFDLINTDTNRLVMQKKVDNQLTRVWYGYFLLKDDNGNIIPSNSFDIKLDISKMTQASDGRYVLPAGSYLRLDPSNFTAEVVDESDVPDLYTERYFLGGYYYYITVYSIMIDTDPLYSSYYLTTCNYDSYFVYEYVNEDSDVQFIANRFNFMRNLKIDPDQYKLSFSIARSINDNNFEGISEETVTVVGAGDVSEDKVITTENLKVILVMYKDGEPYRWLECNMDNADETNAIYSFTAAITTDNEYDDKNNIKIIGANRAGYKTALYGYMSENTDIKIYILAKIPYSSEISYPRMDLDNIAPGYEDYVVTNIYSGVSGVDFFKNYTNIINNKISPTRDDYKYIVSNVPSIGAHYILSDTEANFVVDAINDRKDYIDYCLTLVENSMNIDFKFFNTYGPSRTYTLEDEETFIGHIDITMDFKVSIKPTTDASVVDDIKAAIKAYIEDLNDLTDFHAPNLITDMINKFSDRIYFLEFVGFNLYGADDQHIIKVDVEDPDIVPEFINIRNVYDEEAGTIVPSINIELV